MIENLLLVGQHVLVLFILVAVGMISNYLKIFDQNSVDKMTDFVLFFVNPCVIIKSFQRELNASMVKGLGIVFCVAIFAHIIAIIMAKFFIKDKDVNKSRVLKFSVIFCNCGFMSLPLQEAILGDDGVFYGSVYVAAFTVFVWSYGFFLMGGGLKGLSVKKIILNPGMISVAIGLLLAVLSIKLPLIIFSPVKYMAYLNTPLPMVIIGFYIAQLSFKDTFKQSKSYIATLLRLVVIPLITIGVLLLLEIRGTLLIVCAIASSTPTAALTVMFSNKFNRDTKLAAQLVSISTIISIITMPIIIGLAQYYS